jgi:hypothetical protein
MPTKRKTVTVTEPDLLYWSGQVEACRRGVEYFSHLKPNSKPGWGTSLNSREGIAAALKRNRDDLAVAEGHVERLMAELHKDWTMRKRAPRFTWRRVQPLLWEIEPNELSPIDEGNKEAGIDGNGIEFYWHVQIWVVGPQGGLPKDEGGTGTSSTYELAADMVRRELKAKPIDFAYYVNVGTVNRRKFELTTAAGVAPPKAPKKPKPSKKANPRKLAKSRGGRSRADFKARRAKIEKNKTKGSAWSKVRSFLGVK